MDPYTYFLAFARLALVQCVSFGHPDTTGIRTLDYFISSDLFETSDAASHYSEELFLLHDLGTLAYYKRPPAPNAGKERPDFGLPPDSSVYICPQALFKIHPDFDLILVDILQRDLKGVLVLLETNIPDHGHLLLKRLALASPDVCKRILFLPQQEQEDFIRLIELADVMLDTIHFNGMNTNLEAFSVGTPVVTMPTQLQRGRHTLGMYRRMGITDCIATSPHNYAEIAVRLATDRELHKQIKRRILEKSCLLYEDQAVVREFERFFREAVTRSDRKRRAAR
jgi:predicted O-linked N-acetylglucosamine transferase (SPINDLY family)